MNEKRENWLDIIKALGIICMVFEHAYIYMFSTNYFYVPIFWIIAGYVFKNVSIKIFLWKKIKRLYIPFVICNIVCFILPQLLPNLLPITYHLGFYENLKSFIDILCFNILSSMAAPTWFIFALFITNIEFLVIYKISRVYKTYQDIILFICCLIMSLIGIIYRNYFNQYIYGNCSIITIMFYSMFFYCLGYLLKKYSIKMFIDKYYEIKYGVSAVSIISIIILNYDCYRVGYRTFNLNMGFPALIVPIMGFIIFFVLAELIIKKNILKRIMNYIGKNTLYILLYHILCFQIIGIIQLKYAGFSLDNVLNSWICISAVGFWKYMAAILGICLPIGVRYLLNMYLK